MDLRPSSSPASSVPNKIAGRYRLMRRIARGGMGEVYAVVDEASGDSLALKRLRRDVVHREPQFRAEYHALSQLRHPRIIRVFDYGVDDGVPFYTMELLAGRDLRDVAPLSHHEACQCLRDVASSLALLHARRWVHRDLSPRNVRRLADGTCKLIDFGTMAPFGRPSTIAGTAPYVPPEAVYGAALDQRADLYSLGALAYWLLSGREAVDAKSFDDLPGALTREKVPLRLLCEDLPSGLDELVMSLLSHNPANRPSTAAEVITRLSAIAELEPDDAVHAPSFFVSGGVAGRIRPLAEIERVLDRALLGKGAGLCFRGSAGVGKSRLLAECAVLAQTRGLLVINAHAAHGGHEAGPRSLASDMLCSLRRAAPDLVDATWEQRVSAVGRADGAPEDSSAEVRARTHDAFVALVADLAQTRPLVMVIDDVDEGDEFSVGLVAALARSAPALSLAVVASMAEENESGSANLDSLLTASRCVDLGPLDQEAARELVCAWFGSTPHLDLLADWLYRGARGNPWLTMELARHLVERGVVRYVEGAWILPFEEIREDVPESLAETLSLRLAPLGAEARELLQMIALCVRSPSLALLLGASKLPSDSALSALEELVHEGLVVAAGDGYAFAQSAFRAAVRRTITPERERLLHRRLGDTLLSRDASAETRLAAGVHLVHSDDELRGAHILAELGPRLIDQGEGLRTLVPALERALDVYERHGVALARRLLLKTGLVRAGYLYDHRLALRHGEPTLAALYHCAGLDWADRLRPMLGARIAMLCAFFVNAYRYVRARGPDRPLGFSDALVCFSRVASTLVGLCCTAVDPRGARKITNRMQSLAGLPAALGGLAVRHACEAWTLQVEGREALVDATLKKAHAATDRISKRATTTEERGNLRAGIWLSEGINECYRAGSKAESQADALEADGSALSRAQALRIRMTYHTLRGDTARMEHYRRLLELHAIAGGSTWQVEWFFAPIEAGAGATFGDLVAVRRGVERLEQLTHEVPSLATMRDMARIALHYRRGEYRAAVRLGEAWLREAPPQSIIGWGVGRAMVANSHSALGEYERARVLCEEALAVLTPADREYVVMYALLEAALAVAHAGLGQREIAYDILDRRMALLKSSGELGFLAVFHEARVLSARALRDDAAIREALAQFTAAAKESGSDALVALAARMVQASSHPDMDAGRLARSDDASERPESGEAQEVITQFQRGGRHKPLRESGDVPISSSDAERADTGTQD
jgi:tetratricopeptide (TPR) repeat protein